MKNKKSICQSCGIPLSTNNYGTKEDLSPNLEYCIFCFKDETFTSPDLTLELQIEKLTEIAIQKFGTPRNDAIKLAKTILPTLKRWQ